MRRRLIIGKGMIDSTSNLLDPKNHKTRGSNPLTRTKRVFRCLSYRKVLLFPIPFHAIKEVNESPLVAGLFGRT